MAAFQRTDCINCGARIYHPALYPIAGGHNNHEIQFFGTRPQGSVFHHSTSEHHILLSPDGDFAIATCMPYYRLHEAFDTFERIVVGTRHQRSTEHDDGIPF